MSYCIIMLPFLRPNNTSAVHYWALMCVFRRNNKVNIRRKYLVVWGYQTVFYPPEALLLTRVVPLRTSYPQGIFFCLLSNHRT